MSRRKGDTNEKAKENALKCLQLRAQGYTCRQIAKHLGYKDHSAVVLIIQREVARLPIVEAQEVRRLDYERLDELQAAFMPKALEEAHEGAATVVLKIMERKAKLLGLDAPTKVAQTDAEGNSIAYSPTQQLLAVIAAKANIQVVSQANGATNGTNGHHNGHLNGNGNGHEPSGN